jgi:hypothetical protein
MTIASTVLRLVGSPSADYIGSNNLPPVKTARFERTKTRPLRIAGTGTQISAGVIASLDTNAETKGALWYGKLGKDGVSGKMLRNPHITQSVDYAVNPLSAASWGFDPASPSEFDREVADYNTYCFLECLPWYLILERMVGGATIDGFGLSEMTDDMRPIPTSRFPFHPGKGIGLVPTAMHEIPANTVGYWRKKKDNPDQLESVEQWQSHSDTEDAGYRSVPADRIVRLTLKQKGGNFAGVPTLRAVYSAWKLLDAFERYRAIGFERTSVGTPVATAPDGEFNKDEADSIELALENMRTMAKGALVLPGGYTLQWSGAGENDLANLNIAIESLKTDIAINMSAGFSRLGLVGPGSYALGDTQLGQYHLATDKRAKLYSLIFNLGLDGWSPVKRITEANYGVGCPLPKLRARNLPTRDIKTIMPLLFQAIQNKAITPDDPLEDECRDMLTVGPRDESTERKSAPPVPFTNQKAPPVAPKPEPEDEQEPIEDTDDE